jgi:hypothetical protein
MNPEFIKASEVRLHNLENYYIRFESWESRSESNWINNLKSLDLRKGLFSLNAYFGIENIKTVSKENKKSFTNFTKAYNKCFRVIHQMG